MVETCTYGRRFQHLQLGPARWVRRPVLSNPVGFNTPASAPKAGTKRVFLVTDEDNPHNGHVHMDTVAHNILEVRLFLLIPSGQPPYLTGPLRSRSDH